LNPWSRRDTVSASKISVAGARSSRHWQCFYEEESSGCG
jgi:hypothetical protein